MKIGRMDDLFISPRGQENQCQSIILPSTKVTSFVMGSFTFSADTSNVSTTYGSMAFGFVLCVILLALLWLIREYMCFNALFTVHEVRLQICYVWKVII